MSATWSVEELASHLRAFGVDEDVIEEFQASKVFLLRVTFDLALISHIDIFL